MAERILVRFAVFAGALLTLTACPEKKIPPEPCMKVSEVITREVVPAGVQTVFQVRDCRGEPVTDLKNKHLEVLLDGDPIQSEGATSRVLNEQVDFKQYALLLLDMSDSIVDSGALAPMIDAARALVGKLNDEGMRVAIYKFAGPKYFEAVQSFTEDRTALNDALDLLADSDGLGTTDLYGSMVKAISLLEQEGDAAVLSSRTLVVLTDGTDEARESTYEAAAAAVTATEANVFTVGLGGDVNKAELRAFGKTGFEWVEDADKLKAAFEAVSKRVTKLAGSFYLVGVCSPRTKGIREMTLVVTKGGKSGRLTVSYDASGFDIVGCDASRVAYPCKDLACGSVDGFYCGGCDTGEYCDGDFTCQDACAGYVCGESNGTSCGACDGENEVCEAHQCVTACDGRECGDHLGVSCGSCEDGFECNSDGACQPLTIEGLEWAEIEGGEVAIGCDVVSDNACGFDELAHTVQLSDFWMMTTEVTVDMYRSCVSEGACDPVHVENGGLCTYQGDDGDKPMNCVDWEGLAEFCAFVGARLPTEAEFERALRGDHDGVNDTYWIYPWGNSPSPSCDRVVMNEGAPGCGADTPSVVGSRDATGAGLFDLAGNVAEWTGDFYGETFAPCDPAPCEDPAGPTDGTERVVRGGAFDDMFASAFRTAKRTKAAPETTSPAIGGRCVK